jgi:steroid delta-isomerase-like uncharacterized protein
MDIQDVLEALQNLWNNGKTELASQVYRDAAERKDPNQPKPARGPKEIASYVAGVRTGFPDFNMALTRTVAAGDDLVIEWTCTGTHRAPWGGIPATGRHVEVSGATIVHMENGQIADERVYFDRLALLEQLGIASSPEAQTASASANA